MLLQIREGRVKNVTCAAAGQMLKVSAVRVTHRAACMYAVVQIPCQPSDALGVPALLRYIPDL